MEKVITADGIVIETKGDTLYFSNIPEEDTWGLFSIKYEDEDTLAQNVSFPRGTWKKVINGETSYCLRDRGEGRHLVFIAFLRERKSSPDYSVQYTYLVDISEDNEAIFPVKG